MFFSVLLTRKENILPPITIPQNTATHGMTCPSVADDILLNIYRYGSVPCEGSNLHCDVGGLRVASDLVAALGRCTQLPYHAVAIDSVSLLRFLHRDLAGVHLPCAQRGSDGVGVRVVLLDGDGHT